MKTLIKKILLVLFSLGLTNNNFLNAQEYDVCGVLDGPGYTNYYVDSDGDGIGEGDPVESCNDITTSTCSNLNFTLGNYTSEVSWNITNDEEIIVSGNTNYNQELCLPFGTYTLNMYDSYGDGWNGNILNYNGQNFTFNSGSSDTQYITITAPSPPYVLVGGDNCIEGISSTITVGGGSWPSEVSWSIIGCDGATIISGGAPFDQCHTLPDNYTIQMNDSYGDGWNGNVLSISGNEYGFSSGYTSLASIGNCAPKIDTIPEITIGYQSSTDLMTIDELYNSGVISDSDNSLDELIITLNVDSSIISINWDGVYTSPISISALGNFVGETTIELCVNDNNSTVCQTNTINVICDNPVSVNSGSYPSEISWSIIDCDGEVILEGGAPFSGCISLVDYSINMNDSYGDGWNGANLTIGEASYTISSGSFGSDDGLCSVYGCTDSNACNYFDSADTDDGSCVYASGCDNCFEGLIIDNDQDDDGVCDSDEIVGCQDNSACNYMETATDDGSCIYSFELDVCATCSGVTDGSGYIVDNDQDNDGVCDDDEVLGCQDSNACNYMASATDSDVCIFAIDCESCSGEIDGSGYIVDNDQDNDGVCDADEVLGCMDNGNDVNAIGLVYDNLEDGLPSYNYSSIATDDDGSCIPFIYGCMSEWADNYNDYDSDGVKNSITGDPNVDVNTDDGSCLRLGCINDWADNYDNLATEDNGSCIRLGCVSDWADNYDPLATDDDGSCELLACTEDWADNYNEFATYQLPDEIQEDIIDFNSFDISVDSILNLNNYGNSIYLNGWSYSGNNSSVESCLNGDPIHVNKLT